MVARCAAGRLGIQDLLGMGGVIVGRVVGSLFDYGILMVATAYSQCP